MHIGKEVKNTNQQVSSSEVFIETEGSGGNCTSGEERRERGLSLD